MYILKINKINLQTSILLSKKLSEACVLRRKCKIKRQIPSLKLKKSLLEVLFASNAGSEVSNLYISFAVLITNFHIVAEYPPDPLCNVVQMGLQNIFRMQWGYHSTRSQRFRVGHPCVGQIAWTRLNCATFSWNNKLLALGCRGIANIPISQTFFDRPCGVLNNPIKKVLTLL